MDDRFYLRRLEALSDIVFGVAMTLLAYDLPLPDPHAPAPSLRQIFAAAEPHLLPLVLSFVVAGLYWLANHRRLAMLRRASAALIVLSFGFLLAIVVLPWSTNLFGSYNEARDVTILYAGHLAVLSALNLVLWVVAIRGAVADGAAPALWGNLGAPLISAVILTALAILALWQPGVAQELLYAALLTPLLDRARQLAWHGRARYDAASLPEHPP